MEKKQQHTSQLDLTQTSVHDSIYNHCSVMLDYAVKTGKGIEVSHVEPLKKAKSEIDQSDLIAVYNYLSKLIKPAKPDALLLFEKNKQSKSIFRFLGPLPIVRAFMLVIIISLLTFIGISLSPLVSNDSMQLSLIDGEGLPQIARHAFLLAAASIGGSFYALFQMNTFIKQGSFDTKYASTYWSRYVLGLVAGMLLSELFSVFIDTNVLSGTASEISGSSSSGAPLIKPILAILGGFSANLVHRILSRLIEAVESIFKGSAEEMIANKQAEVNATALANEHMLKNTVANNLLSLKQKLITEGASQGAIDQIDKALLESVQLPIPKTDIPS